MLNHFCPPFILRPVSPSSRPIVTTGVEPTPSFPLSPIPEGWGTRNGIATVPRKALPRHPTPTRRPSHGLYFDRRPRPGPAARGLFVTPNGKVGRPNQIGAHLLYSPSWPLGKLANRRLYPPIWLYVGPLAFVTPPRGSLVPQSKLAHAPPPTRRVGFSGNPPPPFVLLELVL